MRYRKKPVVIEAMQLPVGGMDSGMEHQTEIMGWMVGAGMMPKEHVSIDEDGWHMETLEGTMLASWGDFIIKGIEGEFYPCKPDIFDKTYDPVVD